MSQLLFSFVFSPETKEAVFAGNIEPAQALHILQDLVIAEMQRRALQSNEKNEEKAQ